MEADPVNNSDLERELEIRQIQVRTIRGRPIEEMIAFFRSRNR